MSAEKLISDTVLPTLKDIQDRLTVLELKNQSDNNVNSQELELVIVNKFKMANPLEENLVPFVRRMNR